MRLYKITAKNDETTKTQWVGSKAEGVQARKKLADDGWKRKEIEEVEVEVDVPADKAGLLLEFLNAR